MKRIIFATQLHPNMVDAETQPITAPLSCGQLVELVHRFSPDHFTYHIWADETEEVKQHLLVVVAGLGVLPSVQDIPDTADPLEQKDMAVIISPLDVERFISGEHVADLDLMVTIG